MNMELYLFLSWCFDYLIGIFNILITSEFFWWIIILCNADVTMVIYMMRKLNNRGDSRLRGIVREWMFNMFGLFGYSWVMVYMSIKLSEVMLWSMECYKFRWIISYNGLIFVQIIFGWCVDTMSCLRLLSCYEWGMMIWRV